jgi:hypothetical protein
MINEKRKAALKNLPKIYLEKLDFICFIEADALAAEAQF